MNEKLKFLMDEVDKLHSDNAAMLNALKDIALGQMQMPTAEFYERHTVSVARQVISQVESENKNELSKL